MLHVPPMEHIGPVIVEARKLRGLTQQELADAIGVSRPAVGQWEKGRRAPSLGHLRKLAAVLQIRWEAASIGYLREDTRPFDPRRTLTYGADLDDMPLPEPLPGFLEVTAEDRAKRLAERRAEPNVRLAPKAPVEALSAQVYLPLDVPVLGVSMGGDGHDFQFNGQTVDYVRRPLGIANARQAYATYVIGDSMVPAFREGALLFVNPDKPPSIGDDVVIELRPETDGEPGAGYIKRLKKRTASRIVVEQFNPPKDLEFEWVEVRAIHRVVPWNELLGI